MIINQTIRSGFVTVNKTGAYFSLISAGGVVNVRLSEKGRVVLDTKMWVGMSIDKAIPFDEITITGDDGAVEFWAGDVSMSQARFSNSAAKAIRTKQVAVEGEVQVTSSDFTRAATRLRTNKDVYLGGAGVGGTGWKLLAGTTEEIPLAGTLTAYKQPAFLDASATELLNTDLGGYDEGVSSSYWHWESDDGKVRLAHNYNGSNPLRLWTDSNPLWIDHPKGMTTTGISWNTCDICDLQGERGEIWIVALNSNQVGFYVSKDKGLSFRLVRLISHGMNAQPVGMGRGLTRSGAFLTINAGYYYAVFNIDSSEFMYTQKGVANYKRHMFTDWLNGYRGAANSNDRLQRTYDGGLTWVDHGVSPSGWSMNQFAINQRGDFFIGKMSAGMVISYDFLETYQTYNVYVASSAESNEIVFISNDMALMACTNLKVVLVYRDSSGQTAFEEVADLAAHGAVAGKSYQGMTITEQGRLTVGYGDDIYRFNVNIIGDLLPATVEVMELLS